MLVQGYHGKPLSDICGKPMIWWVYNETSKVEEIDELYVATDDKRIAEECQKYNMKYIMTSTEHKNGTERAIEVSKSINADYYLVIMGDEPLIQTKDIKEFLTEVKQDENFDAYMLGTTLKKPIDVVNDTTIKLAISNNKVIFMSRAEIPYPKERLDFNYYKNVGLYIFPKQTFKFYDKTPMGMLESVEGIEMLRLLENGKVVKVKLTEKDIISVDTAKDLKRINEIIRKRENNNE